MALDSVSSLGKSVGSMISTQSTLRENLDEKDSINIDTIRISEAQLTSGTLTITKKTYADDSFIIDHIVLGELDSTVLKLDGGYSASEVVSEHTI